VRSIVQPRSVPSASIQPMLVEPGSSTPNWVGTAAAINGMWSFIIAAALLDAVTLSSSPLSPPATLPQEYRRVFADLAAERFLLKLRLTGAIASVVEASAKTFATAVASLPSPGARKHVSRSVTSSSLNFLKTPRDVFHI